MSLRWFVVCDNDGVKTSPVLQFWNKSIGCWEEVKYIECKEYHEHAYMTHEQPEFMDSEDLI